MKKKFIIITLICCLFSYIDVYAADAKEYSLMELIPVEETASVSTEIFDYKRFKYETDIPNETYGVLEFDSVYNKTRFEKPISVSVLLFNEDKINIGLVNYCSTKDLSGEYAQLKVGAKSSTKFTIYIDRNYFTGNYIRSDVKYIAIVDSNEKCYIGEENKYAGLTMADIKVGRVSPDYNKYSIFYYLSFIVNMGIYAFLACLMVIMSIYTYLAIVMNRLNKEMFNKKTKLTFIPFVRIAISMNISFGRILAFIHVGILILGILMAVMNSNFILLIVYFAIALLSFIINIVKYKKKNYNFMHFDPFIVNDGTNPVYAWKKIKVSGQKKAQQILDLSYNDASVESMNTVPETVPIQVVDSKDQIIDKLEQVSQSTVDQSVIDQNILNMNLQPQQGVQQQVVPQQVMPQQGMVPQQVAQVPDTAPQISKKEQRRMEKEQRRLEKERIKEEKRQERLARKNKNTEVVEEEKSFVQEALESADEIPTEPLKSKEDMAEFMDMFR